MSVDIITGDALEVLRTLPDEQFQCIVTSPPYFNLRDYGQEGQIGLEETPQAFIARLAEVFEECRRVLRSDGVMWVNMGDSYSEGGNGGGGKNDTNKGSLTVTAKKAPAGYKPKNLLGIPWRLAFALQDAGWWLRQDIIWSKPNPMPESVRDRCTKAHEYIFMLTKSARYFYDADAIKENMADSSLARLSQNVDAQEGSARVPGKTNGNMKAVGGRRKTDKQRGHGRRRDGFNDRWDGVTKAEQQSMGRNKRSVWTIATQPYSEAHFATFPPALPEICIKASTKPGDHVLDPFGGAGTTGLVADRLQRHCTLIELNPEYAEMARKRIDGDAPLLNTPQEVPA